MPDSNEAATQTGAPNWQPVVIDHVQNHGRSVLGLYPPTDPPSKDDVAAWRQA